MSKGHCGPGLYAALAVKGFFPEEWLNTLNEPHTKLPSHCDRNLTPGIDMTTGSLGQGASLAAGMALGLKLNGQGNKVFCILGDGECDEGQVWEMLLFASARKLSNLITFVDYNRKQLDGSTDDILPLGSLEENSGPSAGMLWRPRAMTRIRFQRPWKRAIQSRLGGQ